MSVRPPLLPSPWLGLGVTIALFFGLVCAARLYQLLRRPPPEVVRKFFHIGGSLLALLLPWLFDEFWPVLVVAGLAAVTFGAMRLVPFLRRSLGQVLGAVNRPSIGEFCFLAAIVALFGLSGGSLLLYSIPLLVLASADTVAALVGIMYGKFHFPSVEGGEKSAEGSIAFFLVAFLAVHVPVLLGSSINRTESLLCAVNIALVATFAEGISWRGLDNFFVPFFCFILLKTYLGMPASSLLIHLAALLGLCLYVVLWRRRTNLETNALFGAILFAYIVFLLAGWRWIISPILLFGSYMVLSKKVELDTIRHINFPVVLSILLTALVWAILYWLLKRPELFYPYATSYGINIALIALVRHKHTSPATRWPRLIAVNVAKGTVLLIPPMLIYEIIFPGTLLHVMAGTVAITVASLLFSLMQPRIADYPLDAPRWARQCLCVSLSSVLSLAPSYLPIVLRLGWEGRS